MESIHEVVEEIEEEFQILRDLSSHPNLPKFHGIYLKQDPQTEDQFWIAMEVRLWSIYTWNWANNYFGDCDILYWNIGIVLILQQHLCFLFTH